MLDYSFINSHLTKRDTDINEYILPLYGVVVGMGAKVVVELGAGQSTFALTAAVNATGGQFTSVDIFADAYLRSYPEGQGLLDNEERCQMVIVDDMELVKTWDKPIDFLFIDTSHTLEHTRRELAAWTQKIRQGGVFAMHDTAHKDGPSMGCRQALNEFLEANKDYRALHLLDTKHIGLSFVLKP